MVSSWASCFWTEFECLMILKRFFMGFNTGKIYIPRAIVHPRPGSTPIFVVGCVDGTVQRCTVGMTLNAIAFL